VHQLQRPRGAGLQQCLQPDVANAGVVETKLLQRLRKAATCMLCTQGVTRKLSKLQRLRKATSGTLYIASMLGIE
jgi:hypothetical protein